jgi:hypothetical protein
MDADELEPGPGKAVFMAREYRLRAQALDAFPELAEFLGDPEFDGLVEQAMSILDVSVDDGGLD